MCANSPRVSCVSVQSGNDTGRIKKPQSDAISEYVYSGVEQNLNRPFRPRDFSVLFFLKKKKKALPFMSCSVILPWNIPVRHALDHPFLTVNGEAERDPTVAERAYIGLFK